MKKITAIMEVYNEEGRIGNVLDSMKEFDQIIIIDKASIDKTVEIARKYKTDILKCDYYDGVADSTILKKVFEISHNDWIMLTTCSDVFHKDLYKNMVEMITEYGDMYQAIKVPKYTFSMGVMSKYSYYGGLYYQVALVNRRFFDFSSDNIHNPMGNYERIGVLKPKEKYIAVYHLTHQNLSLIMERHLRYAKVEAETDQKKGTRKEYLDKSWKSIIRMMYYYVRCGIWRLKEVGRAQICMLLLYRCANYLNLYMNTEEEANILKKYAEIREKCILGEKIDV